MDKRFAGKNPKSGILDQVGDRLGAPAKKVVVGVFLPEPNPECFAGDHENEQPPGAQFFQKLTQDGEGILHMFQGIVGNDPVERFPGNPGKIGGGGNPEGFRGTASLRVNLHAKLAASRKIGQKPSPPAAKIQNIQIRGKPFFKLDPVGPAPEFPNGGVPIKICF